MSVYSLNSDDKFITPSCQNVEVRLYKGDTNDFKVTQTAYWSDHWSDPAYRVGPTAEKYKALQVFGTTIEGDRFQELVDELKAIEEGGILIFVNRLGLCIISEIRHPSIKAMRINDYFGWSKYGVRVPLEVIRTSTVWNKFDMHNGETVIDVQRIVRSDADEAIEELRRSLEEKDLELTACKKELEEKSMELTSCRKELVLSKNIESLWRKLVEEKEKVNEMMQSQILAFKADHHDVERENLF
ncbi:unnamed protein product [Linum trigynum]|uniref:Uncharacterized protein n=1 Tax=Linum trigynum TaxID=586398 RepID=A0AAV2DGH2_9ROSI